MFFFIGDEKGEGKGEGVSTLSALYAFESSGQRFERQSMKKPKT